MAALQITQEKYLSLKKKLHELLAERKQVLIRLKEAREQGDLSENAAYHYAKFELGSIGRQTREIRAVLNTAEVVDHTQPHTVIEFGAKVVLDNGKKQITYMIVGAPEANPSANKISGESPLGQALQGKKAGDTVVFQAPVGEIRYTVVSIQ